MTQLGPRPRIHVPYVLLPGEISAELLKVKCWNCMDTLLVSDAEPHAITHGATSYSVYPPTASLEQE